MKIFLCFTLSLGVLCSASPADAGYFRSYEGKFQFSDQSGFEHEVRYRIKITPRVTTWFSTHPDGFEVEVDVMKGHGPDTAYLCVFSNQGEDMIPAISKGETELSPAPGFQRICETSGFFGRMRFTKEIEVDSSMPALRSIYRGELTFVDDRQGDRLVTIYLDKVDQIDTPVGPKE